MKKLFIDIVSDSVNSKKILQIYTDKNDTDKFSAGYVHLFSNESIVLRSIDPNGFDDGFILFRADDIYAVEIDTIYSKRLQNIAENRVKREIGKTALNFKKWKKEGLNAFVLKQLLTYKILTTVKLVYDNGFTGFIKRIDSESLLIENVNNDGQLDGYSCVVIDDIERIYFAGFDQEKIERLMQ